MSDYDDERPSKRPRRGSSPYSRNDRDRPYGGRLERDRDRDTRPNQGQKTDTTQTAKSRTFSRSAARDYGSDSASDVSRDRSKDRRSDKHREGQWRRSMERSNKHDSENGRRSRSPASGDHNSYRSRRKTRDRQEHHDRYRRDKYRSRSRSTSRQRHGRHNEDREDNHKYRSSRTRKSPSPKPHSRSKAPLPSQNDAFTSKSNNPDSSMTITTTTAEKQKPNFNLTGKLAAASNTIQTANQTIILKYHEPSEARKPPTRDAWRMYIFKESEILDTIELHTQSCWLLGREVAVVDIPTEHPSCSKQHAVIQFRYVEKRTEFGERVGKVKPYVIDLESAHGTMVNGDRIPEGRYVEVRDKDVLKFGGSTREYVVQLPGMGGG